MKKIVCLVGLFLLSVVTVARPVCVFDREGGFYCDTTVFVSTYSLPCLGGSLVVSCDNGILYCINNENTKEGSILLGCFDEKTNSSSASLLKFPRHHAKLGNLSLFPLQGFVLHSEKLYLSQQGVLYCFEKDSNSFVLSDSICFFDNTAYRIERMNDSLVLLHSMQHNGKVVLKSLDLDKKKIIHTKELDFSAVLTCFSPRDVVCVWQNRILFTPANEYKIEVYDFDFNKVDSICLQKENWLLLSSQREKEMLQQSGGSPSDLIYMFSQDVRTKSTIARLLPLGEELAVLYTESKDGKLHPLYDLWRKGAGSWQLVAEGVDDYYGKDKSENRLLPYRQFVVSNGIVYAFSAGVPLPREEYKSEKAYIKAVEKWQLKEECRLQISKLKFRE